MSNIKLSIITSVYNTEAYLQAFYQRISDSARKITSDYELIFVNDGSPGDATAILRTLHLNDPRIVVIDLSRNFGQHIALWTGLQQAKGDKIFYIDSDLDEKPEWLELYNDSMETSHADIVFGVQAHRNGSRILYTVAAAIFYGVLTLISQVEFKRDIVNARLMTKRYLQSLLLHHERHVELSVLCHLTGFTQSVIMVEKEHRIGGSYNWSRLLSLLNDYLISATVMPLYILTAIGCVSFLTGCFVLIPCMIYGLLFSSTLASCATIWLFRTGIMTSIGIMSFYLAGIMKEVRQRPLVIIKHIYRHESA